MTFLRMISCFSSYSTISPPFTKKGNHYEFQIEGYHNLHFKRFHINDLLNYVQGHMSITHKIKDLYNTESRINIFILHISSKGHKSTKTRHTYALPYHI